MPIATETSSVIMFSWMRNESWHLFVSLPFANAVSRSHELVKRGKTRRKKLVSGITEHLTAQHDFFGADTRFTARSPLVIT